MTGKGEGAGGSNRKIRRATHLAGNNRSRRPRQYQHLQYYVGCPGARRILHRKMREDDVGGEARQRQRQVGHVRRQGPKRKSPRGFQAFLPRSPGGFRDRGHPRRSPRVVRPRCSVGFSRRRAINRADLISTVEAVCKIDKQISTGNPLPSWRDGVVVHETSGRRVNLDALDVDVGCGVGVLSRRCAALSL